MSSFAFTILICPPSPKASSLRVQLACYPNTKVSLRLHHSAVRRPSATPHKHMASVKANTDVAEMQIFFQNIKNKQKSPQASARQIVLTADGVASSNVRQKRNLDAWHAQYNPGSRTFKTLGMYCSCVLQKDNNMVRRVVTRFESRLYVSWREDITANKGLQLSVTVSCECKIVSSEEDVGVKCFAVALSLSTTRAPKFSRAKSLTKISDSLFFQAELTSVLEKLSPANFYNTHNCRFVFFRSHNAWMKFQCLVTLIVIYAMYRVYRVRPPEQ